MSVKFKIIDRVQINDVIPLVEKLNDYKVSKELLIQRFSEMVAQNYECAVACHDDKIIGVCGLWFCTRHYAGRSVEFDHVYIEEDYRNQGIGKQFFLWLDNYVKRKGCEASELNTYVVNYPSHKFYYNEGYQILGYHFLKKL